jgi:pimeloyl-ACP methyl ester carboxylesterase
MREIAVKIGQPIPLTGIITQPNSFDASKPAIVILNSGLMHHIGTCRLSVKLARQLADSGFLSIRFDFSGLGDSAPRRGTSSYRESILEELKEVLDYLQQTKGINKFICYGLCSGAHASYEFSQVDQRVVAIAQIDPYCYRTWKWYLRHYGPRLLKLKVWLHFFTRRLKSKQKPKDLSDSDDADNFIKPNYPLEYPERSEVANGLKIIVDRGINIYCIFTGGQTEVFNYKSQFRECFYDVNFKQLLTDEYYPEMNHIITHPYSQKMVINNICAWINRISNNTQS